MRDLPTTLGWINHEVSIAPRWDRAQVRRLARYMGYELVWPPIESVIPLLDQVRAADVDILITPSPGHLDVITLNSIMSIVTVETVCPRLTFARWALPSGRIG